MTSTATRYTDPTVRHDMTMLFDVRDGNPNGDPDSGNAPRTDPETGHGLVSDVSIKRKIRDTILAAVASGALSSEQAARSDIFVQTGTALETRQKESYEKVGVSAGAGKNDKTGTAAEKFAAARQFMLDRYIDIRLFGGVLSTKATPELGKFHGPLQITMGRSIEPVVPQEIAITRVVKTTEAGAQDGHGEMGSKWGLPYALYRADIHYSATRAQQTGVTADDLDLLYKVIAMMFDHTGSAARGEMAVRGLWVFTHSNAFGDAPAHTLLDRITVTRTSHSDLPARTFADYTVTVDDNELPGGVDLARLV